MLISSEMLFKELKAIRRDLAELKNRDLQHSIEEVSLNKGAQLLKVAPSTLFERAEAKEIPARKVKSNKSPKGYTYKFRLFDIHKFQMKEHRDHLLDDTEFDYVESAESIAKKFLGDKNGK